MIKKLRIKIIVVIMSILSLVLVSILFTLNFSLQNQNQRQVMGIMKEIAKNDGHMPPRETELAPKPLVNEPMNGSKRSAMPNDFSVLLDETGHIFQIVSKQNTDYSEAEITKLAQLVMTSSDYEGRIDNHAFLVVNKDYGKIIVFLDSSSEKTIFNNLILNSAAIGMGAWLLLFVIVYWLSGWLVRPVQLAFDKQRQFVADASHELKTPITIINANADVLSEEIGQNKWLDFIKSEAQRIGGLVNDLLYLAKFDAAENIYQKQKFNLSQAVINIALPFESLVFEAGKEMALDIPDDVWFEGDESRIKQAVLILLDNAVKNADEKGKIHLSVQENGNKKIISVYNTGQGIHEEEKEKIFERFYRSDLSRARATGGSGLGLAIAKTIAEAHDGKITVESKFGEWIQFSLILNG